MKALVFYESMFGNTEQIARAVAAGLGESVEVQVTEVTDAPTEPDPEVALIVAGGPTHAFSMSRESTRADAIAKGAHEGEREFGLREWMPDAVWPTHREEGHIRHQDRKHAPPTWVSRKRRRKGRPPPWVRVRSEGGELLRP
jgi:hypothetical protein